MLLCTKDKSFILFILLHLQLYNVNSYNTVAQRSRLLVRSSTTDCEDDLPTPSRLCVFVKARLRKLQKRGTYICFNVISQTLALFCISCELCSLRANIQF